LGDKRKRYEKFLAYLLGSDLKDELYDYEAYEDEEFFNFEDEYEEAFNFEEDSLNQDELKLKILKDSLKIATEIYEFSQQEEKRKAKWREVFFKLLSILICITVAVVIALPFLEARGVVNVPNVLLIGLFASIIAEIFALLGFMIRYINDSQYLESFKTITHKLLDYLVADKKDRQKTDE